MSIPWWLWPWGQRKIIHEQAALIVELNLENADLACQVKYGSEDKEAGDG